MSTRIVILTSIALLSFASSAYAGPCAAEIEMLAKSLAATDAGSGPTMGGAPPRTPTS